MGDVVLREGTSCGDASRGILPVGRVRLLYERCDLITDQFGLLNLSIFTSSWIVR